jgi:hypothetical protein
MPINELIAGGIKLPQFNLPDYGADLAQMAQIQNARNQNALAQYQLGAAQRAENENNQLRALFSSPDVDRSSADFVRKIYAISPKEGQKYTKNLLEQQVKKATFEKTESDLLASDIERSAEALASASDITSYKAIHNAIHKDPNSRLGKYFASIGFDRTKADELIAQAENDSSGQLFLNLRYMSGLKGKERADQMRAQTEAAQVRQPTQPGAIQSVGAPAPVPTGNALGVPETGVSNSMVAQPTPTAAPPSRINFVKSEIDRFSNILSNNPSNKLAADRLKALTDEYNQLSAEQGREATLKETKRAAEVREKLDREKHQLEIDKFNASQKEFKVEKTPQGLVQINKNGTVAPILGADGKQVQSLEFAKSEIKTNADGNYIAFNPYTNESRIITGADGKPVRSLEAANAAETKRHNQELERQGKLRLGLEEQRVSQESQRIAESKDRNVVANTVTDEAGNVRQFNKYGELVGDVKPGVGKPSAAFEKSKNLRIQLDKDLSAAIVELKEITKDGGLIDQSTGSGAGRLVDYAAAFGGKALPGAIATAKLKPIQDLVLKTIPRFEGPQSDKDTQSYKEAAGQLADPNMPTAIRKEAAKTVLRLMTNRKNQFVTSEIAGEGVRATGGGVDTNNPLLK